MSEMCKLCSKANGALQNSHIIPEFCYEPLYDSKHRAYQVPMAAPGKSKFLQKGLREKLLCRSCEQYLNDNFEKYFFNLWFNDKVLPRMISNNESILIKGFDYSKFKLFHLSILFRASVSKLDVFRSVNLGLHEERIRLMLMNCHSKTDQEYVILAHAITKENGEIHEGLIFSPFKLRQRGYISYGFSFGGCVWYYFTTSHKIKDFSNFMLTSQGNISIMAINWTDFLNI